MIACEEISSNDVAAFRQRALRDAVVCIGWLKLLSVLCYVLLYFLVHSHSKGSMSNALQIMTLAIVPPQVLHGVLLFLGAVEEKIVALELSLWMCVILAAYNTVLGMMGCIYFIRSGHMTMHFLLAVAFAILALSLFTVICHDLLIVFAYKQSLGFDPDSPEAVTWQK